MRDPDEPDPPPKTYGFKPKEFERLNVPTPAQPPPPSAKDLAVLAGQSARKPNSPASASSASSPTPGSPAVGATPADPNDVYSIRREIRAREQADGGDVVQIKKVRSRRKRDYWLLLITSNVLFGTVTVMGITQRNPMLLAYGLAGVVIVSLGLTWIMWFVMSDY